MVAFFHAADLHLGVRLTRFEPAMAKKIREARFQALENIRDKAKQEQIQFFLIAGDLFDDHAVDQDVALRAYDLLSSFPVPVYVTTGNHDPLLAGSVWDRPPWNRAGLGNVRVLREAAPVDIADGVRLLPCPVLRKTSLNDPTAWIGQAGREDKEIRIGMAHGSLKVRDDLPPDDHLIHRDAACKLKLDYLALGHWHSRQTFGGTDGTIRTAYPGVHEPLRFPGELEDKTGWVPYSPKPLKEFLDQGSGEILHVSIERSGAPPAIQSVEVGYLRWAEENYALHTEEELGRLIDQVGTRPGKERCLLLLNLKGTLDAHGMLRLEHLRDILNRYLYGDLDDTELFVSPSNDEVRELAGQGVLGRVLERLKEETKATDTAVRQTAQRAILVLYQIGREVEH
jgi:DNA repair exonuclease SbcCD nuclease subunit